jgi:hypothetical protein
MNDLPFPDPRMTTPHDVDSNQRLRWEHADFELAAALKEATDAPDAPRGLYRRVPWRRTAAGVSAAVLALALGVGAFVDSVYPPPLVRDALVHEEREATLRGDFQPDKAPLLRAVGLPDGAHLPGLLQLQRPCDIDGHMAYHVTTFLEKGGGIVTILAFDRPLPEPPAGHGQWLGRYWRFAEIVPGRTILLLGDNARALVVTEHLLKTG